MIIENGGNKSASRLVTALKNVTDDFYIEKPAGTFGGKAIIKCGNVTLNSDELDFEFTVPFDDDMEANEAEIIIYNLTNTTVKNLAKGKKITITAGFKGDTGVIFSGYISKRKTTYDGADKQTTLKCLDRLKTRKIKEKTFKKKTKASTILKWLLKQTNTPVKVFKVRHDYTYKDEEKISGDLYENIKNYAEVCGISVYVNKGKIYARQMSKGDNCNFTVSVSTGMINTPSEFEEEINSDYGKETVKGYEVEMLLQHRITAGSVINLKSKNAKDGKYRVKSGEHTFNESEAITKVKVF